MDNEETSSWYTISDSDIQRIQSRTAAPDAARELEQTTQHTLLQSTLTETHQDPCLCAALLLELLVGTLAERVLLASCFYMIAKRTYPRPE